MAALRAGKHVLVEKPIALNYADADALVRQADTSRKILMAGQVLRFAPAYVFSKNCCQPPVPCDPPFSPPLCRPRLEPLAGRPRAQWRRRFRLLIHDADFCISLWAMPWSVRASGFEDMPSGIDSFMPN